MKKNHKKAIILIILSIVFLYIGFFAFVITYEEEDTRSFDTIKLAFALFFESEPEQLKDEEIQAVGAIDGVYFRMNITVYEYESVKAVQEAYEQYPESKSFIKNGRFLMAGRSDPDPVYFFKGIDKYIEENESAMKQLEKESASIIPSFTTHIVVNHVACIP